MGHGDVEKNSQFWVGMLLSLVRLRDNRRNREEQTIEKMGDKRVTSTAKKYGAAGANRRPRRDPGENPLTPENGWEKVISYWSFCKKDDALSQ
jgi:hypothetical protein